MHIKVPATSANLGPGFDCLGLALDLYNEVQVTESDKLAFLVEGEGSSEVPQNEDNLFYRSFAKLYVSIGRPAPAVSVKMLNRIPLARGLGSSASIIIAGLLAANAISKSCLGNEQILQIANEIEGHPDNVGAGLFGGLTVCYESNQKIKLKRFEPSNLISTILFIPQSKLSTEASRGVLPGSLSIADCVFNISRTGLLVGALITGDIASLEAGVEDKLHQPYRMPLLGDFQRLSSVLRGAGVKAVALSGAGPSLIGFTARDVSGRQAEDLEIILKEESLDYKVMALDIATQGAIVSS